MFQRAFIFAYRAVTFFGRPFHAVQLTNTFVTLWKAEALPKHTHDPDAATPSGLHCIGLGWTPFARHY